MITEIARHLETVHKTEKDVRKFMALPKGMFNLQVTVYVQNRTVIDTVNVHRFVNRMFLLQDVLKEIYSLKKYVKKAIFNSTLTATTIQAKLLYAEDHNQLKCERTVITKHVLNVKVFFYTYLEKTLS